MLPRAVSRVLDLVGRARRPVTMRVTAEPETVLLASSAALRRLGARITRYDPDAGTLEARQDHATVRLSAVADGVGGARLALDIDARDARRLIRRFRSELGRGAPPETA